KSLIEVPRGDDAVLPPRAVQIKRKSMNVYIPTLIFCAGPLTMAPHGRPTPPTPAGGDSPRSGRHRPQSPPVAALRPRRGALRGQVGGGAERQPWPGPRGALDPCRGGARLSHPEPRLLGRPAQRGRSQGDLAGPNASRGSGPGNGPPARRRGRPENG